MRQFQKFCDDSGLIEVGFKGFKFTRNNGRFGKGHIRKWLDRVIESRPNKIFRFNNNWTEDPSYVSEVSKSWVRRFQGAFGFVLSRKCRELQHQSKIQEVNLQAEYGRIPGPKRFFGSRRLRLSGNKNRENDC
ncbi:hypothetical protein ACH5RR_035751 [Cinchona calisaya]|uniref:Transposase n=1 Tax=Cinchona calisaya TaxID=153742 RepID=A0ABD2Y5Z6_9GENT